jgi:hypothetical protein
VEQVTRGVRVATRGERPDHRRDGHHTRDLRERRARAGGVPERGVQ